MEAFLMQVNILAWRNLGHDKNIKTLDTISPPKK